MENISGPFSRSSFLPKTADQKVIGVSKSNVSTPNSTNAEWEKTRELLDKEVLLLKEKIAEQEKMIQQQKDKILELEKNQIPQVSVNNAKDITKYSSSISIETKKVSKQEAKKSDLLRKMPSQMSTILEKLIGENPYKGSFGYYRFEEKDILEFFQNPPEEQIVWGIRQNYGVYYNSHFILIKVKCGDKKGVVSLEKNNDHQLWYQQTYYYGGGNKPELTKCREFDAITWQKIQGTETIGQNSSNPSDQEKNFYVNHFNDLLELLNGRKTSVYTGAISEREELELGWHSR